MAARLQEQKGGEMDTRIAIIGMSAILPCGTTVRESWETIRAGIDCLSDLPEDRVDVTAYFDPVKTTKDKIYCKRGGFIPEYDFDAREFGLNMFQMEDSDANQTISLLKVKEALQDAGIDALGKEKKNIGCVLGIGGGQKSSHEFYSRLNYVVVEKVLRKMGMPEEDVKVAVEKYKANFPEWRLDSFPGFLGNVTAGRCTNTFNLDGMNCVVDAACASSLIAVKVAIDELLYGDCDMMVTGATCTDNSIGMYMAFSKTPVFSTDPSVRAYDEKTKGMLIGEGSAMLVLKRYADAVRDGDEIHAVIRGCASSSDGKAAGIYTPTISGQEEALRRAYNRACVDPATVTLVEGHGTGTPVGDRIELTALRNLFDKAYGEGNTEKVAVGSIKSSIGHLKAVAGLAGMIKVIMALKHKTLPGTINVDNPPNLYDNTPINESSLYINTMNRPWFPPPGVPRRAGISSFGFGGANYHAVLEEAEPEHTTAYRLNKRPQPVLMMAATPAALQSLCEAQLKEFEAAIKENETVKNTAYIKCVKFGEQFKFPGSIPATNARLGFLVKDAEDACSTLRAICAQFAKDVTKEAWRLPREGVSFRAKGIATNGAVAALFSGQGAQYTHMFSEVAMNWPQFRQSIAAMDAAQSKVAGSDKDFERVSQVLYPRKPYEREPEQDHKKISLTAYSQPSTLACALGAFEIFKEAGFTPDFAAGHSLGEFAALYAAGCVDRDELFELVCRRARIMGGKDAPATPKGCMAAVIGPNAENIKVQAANVWLGNSNSPSQTVITGSVEGIQAESARLQKEGFRVVPLACESAFHSPQMENASSAFKDVISKVSFRTPKAETKLFSNVSGETYPTDAREMLTQHMTSSVKFLTQVRNMHQAGARIFVEFGPKQVLSKLVSETLKDDPSVVTVSVNPASGTDSDIQLRDAAVQLVVAGVNLQGFDKWDAPDATRMQAIKKKRTTLRLSAATYVSDKTKKVRDAAMNDGRCVTYLKGAAPLIKAPEPVVDEAAKREAERLQKELQDAQRQLDDAKRAAAEANSKLAAAKEEAKTAAASAKPAVDTAVVEKHRAILKSMLAELDGYGSVDASSLQQQQQQQTAPAPVKAAAPAAPVASAPAPAVSNELLEKAETVVMEVLAAKTGYETDMIEADMELETELGIDSIKRVEILSEVQAMLNVEAKDVDALSRTRTVGEVVNAMKAEIAGSSAPAPAAAAPAPAKAAPAAAAPAVSNELLEKAETVVMEVLAAKTGYETDMIESDMELETELGIDSIKRVEILSEVQAMLNVEAKDVDALSRTRTVGEVVNAMKAEIAGGSAPAPAAAAPGPAAAAPAPAAAAPAVSNELLEKAETVVMEVLAAKTGYETDMIESDMELETELGIDSIKRVEILSEVQAMLNVEAKDVDALSRTRTVGEVVDAMKAEIAGGSAPAPAAAAPAPAAAAPAPAAPAPAAPAPAVSSELLEKAETVVMEVLAAKTGYETDMIESDMELETELGIDSIKRVEILSEVQAMLNVEAKDVDALSRTRTVGEVVDAMKAEIAGSSASAPAAAAPAPAAAAPAPAAAAPAVSNELLEKAETVVMEVLAAKTGYETDMIESDMELETELGIDSIKRVEILSEVQAMLNVEAKDVDALSRTRTVGEVVDAMKAEIAGGSAPAPAAAAPAPAAAAPAVSNELLEKAETVVMEVLAAKTGYETDMIESDMELETELGIDSIKRVEILSEVQAMLNVEAKDVDALSRTRTVGEVVDAMKAEIAGGSAPAPAAAAPASAGAAPAVKIDSVHGADCDDLSLMHAKVVDIRRPDELILERPENRPVLVVDDGSELTLALVRVLGACAVVLTFEGLQLAQRAGAAAIRHVLAKDLSAESAEKAIKEAEQRFGALGGFISQQAERFEPAEILGFTLMCAKFAKASLCTAVAGGRPAFIGVARLDGRLGFTSQGTSDALKRAQRGAIFGLCKTIGLEWSESDVFSRGVDIAQGMHPEDAAVAIVREMACADIRIREVGIGANQQRCTIRAAKLETGNPQRQIAKDDVLLVSGGARGITPLCIREITRQIAGGKYILLGRSKVSASEPAWCAGITDEKAVQKAATQELKRAFSAGEGPKPTPRAVTKLVGSVLGAREVRSSIAAIEALGGKAIYSSCDVNSAADVAKAVRDAESQLGARVSGIVHASGVLRDRLIEKKLPDEFDAVFGTKVTGLENLLAAVDRANLKHMVLFSSLAGFHGNVGQSDYAMANEALNKMGLELAKDVSVKSICFGPWDGGMVTPQLKKQFQEMGVQIIPREGGADTVARIVLGSSPAEILVGNWRTPSKKVGSDTITLHRKISAKSNPFLEDHVIQGRRVLPMTLAIGSLAETCLGLFPGYSLWAIDDAQLFKGVTVDGDVNCEVTLTPSTAPSGRVNVQATLKTFSSGKLVPAYRAVIVLSNQGAPPANATMQPPSLDADPALQGSVYDGKTLFHGPAFRGIDDVLSCTKSQLVAKCSAVPGSDAARGEFATDTDAHDPFVNDLAFQAMLVWVRRTLGQAALPNSIQRIVQHRPVPQDKPFYITLRSNQSGGHSQHKHALQFHNEQGDLFIDVQASVIATDSLAF